MNRVTPAAKDAVASSRRRRIIFAALAIGGITAGSCAAVIALDVYMHARLQRFSALNVWGYRGPAVGKKRSGELRIAVLGGSSAFGYGVAWDEAVPAVLERTLRARREASHAGPVTVVNLAYNNEGAYSFRFTLQDYHYLDYDIVSLHSGYNDLILDPGVNRSVYRRDSPVFRAVGYMPILPLVLREKASAWLYGDIAAGYRKARGERTPVFRPRPGASGAAPVISAASATTAADPPASPVPAGSSIPMPRPRQAGGAAAQSRSTADPGRGCPYPWENYCRGLFDAIDYALARGSRALVVTEPYLPGAARNLHVYQQKVMAESLLRVYGGDPRVRYVNTGPSVDLSDPAFGYDRMHLTARGAAIVARQLVDPLEDLARR